MLLWLHTFVFQASYHNILNEYPLHQNQHANRTVLSNVVTSSESAIEHKEITLGAFVDVEQAFDRISFDAERRGNQPTICSWILPMLESRNMTTFSQEILRASTARKCLWRVCFCLCYGVGFWVNFYGDLIRMIIIQ
jgi:hypothetical protein